MTRWPENRAKSAVGGCPEVRNHLEVLVERSRLVKDLARNSEGAEQFAKYRPWLTRIGSSMKLCELVTGQVIGREGPQVDSRLHLGTDNHERFFPSRHHW